MLVKKNFKLAGVFHTAFAVMVLLGIFTILLNTLWIHDSIARYVHTHQVDVPEASLTDYRTLRQPIHGYLMQSSPLQTAILAEATLTEQEIIHMADVQRIVHAMRLLWLVSIAILIGVVLVSDSRSLVHAARKHAVITPIALLIFGICTITFFQAAFFTLHKILFTNDLWLLDPSQHLLIRAYPPLFFKIFFIAWAACVLVAYASVILIGLWQNTTMRYRLKKYLPRLKPQIKD